MTPFERVSSFLRRHRGFYFAGIVSLLVTDLAGVYATHVKTDVLARLEGLAAPSAGRELLWICGLFLGATVLQALGRYFWRMFFLTASHRIVREFAGSCTRSWDGSPSPFSTAPRPATSCPAGRTTWTRCA